VRLLSEFRQHTGTHGSSGQALGLHDIAEGLDLQSDPGSRGEAQPDPLARPQRRDRRHLERERDSLDLGHAEVAKGPGDPSPLHLRPPTPNVLPDDPRPNSTPDSHGDESHEDDSRSRQAPGRSRLLAGEPHSQSARTQGEKNGSAKTQHEEAPGGAERTEFFRCQQPFHVGARLFHGNISEHEGNTVLAVIQQERDRDPSTLDPNGLAKKI